MNKKFITIEVKEFNKKAVDKLCSTIYLKSADMFYKLMIYNVVTIKTNDARVQVAIEDYFADKDDVCKIIYN